MNSWLKVGSFNKKDEYYTPAIMVYPIIEYLKEGSTIWCPFDTKSSEFVKVFSAKGFKVIHSHIWEGNDFFTYEPSEPYDYIISNPPFTKKLDVLRRLFDLNKPFAMILGLPILNYQIIGGFFFGKNLELLIFDKKVSFDGNTASFNCSYFCNGILPKGITFYHLPHNNTGKNFRSQVWQHKLVEKGTKNIFNPPPNNFNAEMSRHNYRTFPVYSYANNLHLFGR